MADAFGAGVYLEASNGLVCHNEIFDNIGAYGGGGIAIVGASPRVLSNTIVRHYRNVLVSGMYIKEASPLIANNIVAFNESVSGIHGAWGNAAILRNNCVYGNTNLNYEPVSSMFDFDIEGDISVDPMLRRLPSGGGDGWGDWPDTPTIDESANDDFGDLRLMPGSPCIDAGDPDVLDVGDFDLDGALRVFDGDGDGLAVIDIGAYEFGSPTLGDVNCDGVVDTYDIDAFVARLIASSDAR